MHLPLVEFIRESNKIEGIERDPTVSELQAHEWFMALRTVRVHDLEDFVKEVADAKLRDQLGMNIRVSSHSPPAGGPYIREALGKLCSYVSRDLYRPYTAHVEYELLHPFMDGNGRSGRVLWAWGMQKQGLDPFRLPFLHRFYYQTLTAAR